MAVSGDDLSAFHDFAAAKIASRGAESLQELVELWEIEHPTPERQAHDIAAIQAAIRDMENGDTGRPARKVVGELRAELARRSDR